MIAQDAGKREEISMSKTAKIAWGASLAGSLLLAGCRQDMHNQPKFYPQRGTTFFADGRSVRPQVDYTVARGQVDPASYLHTGMMQRRRG